MAHAGTLLTDYAACWKASFRLRPQDIRKLRDQHQLQEPIYLDDLFSSDEEDI